MVKIETIDSSTKIESIYYDNNKNKGFISAKKESNTCYSLKEYSIDKLEFDELDGLFRALLNALLLKNIIWFKTEELIPLKKEVYSYNNGTIQIHISSFFDNMGCRGE